jgi:hypothetical protein
MSRLPLEEKMENEKAQYVLRHYGHSMTTQERLAQGTSLAQGKPRMAVPTRQLKTRLEIAPIICLDCCRTTDWSDLPSGDPMGDTVTTGVPLFRCLRIERIE